MAEPLDATFFAFRKRQQGGVLTGLSIAFVVAMILLFVGWVALAALAFGASYGQFATSSAPPLAAMGGMMLSYFLLLFGMFVLIAAYEAGCLRWMIRGERKGLFGLAFDADTWRVYGGYWLWLVFVIVGYLLFALAIAVLGGIGAMVFQDAPVAVMIWMVLAVIACLCGVIYLAVRTAPAAATSIGMRRFAFFDAWKVSKGRFWPLFGSYFLLIVCYVIAILVLWGVTFGSAYMAMFSASAAGDPSAASNAMAQMLGTPAAIALYVGVQLVGLVIATVFYVLNFGVNARAVLAAGEEGKIEGLINPDIAKTFE